MRGWGGRHSVYLEANIIESVQIRLWLIQIPGQTRNRNVKLECPPEANLQG